MRKRRGSRGQATVEFALVGIIFIFILMILFDFGRGVAAFNAVSHAAREGARLAVHHPAEFTAGTDANIRGQLRAGSPLLPGLTDADITISPAQASRDYGDIVTVQVVYSFSPVTPLIGVFLPGGTVTLTSAGKAVVQ